MNITDENEFLILFKMRTLNVSVSALVKDEGAIKSDSKESANENMPSSTQTVDLKE